MYRWRSEWLRWWNPTLSSWAREAVRPARPKGRSFIWQLRKTWKKNGTLYALHAGEWLQGDQPPFLDPRDTVWETGGLGYWFEDSFGDLEEDYEIGDRFIVGEQVQLVSTGEMGSVIAGYGSEAFVMFQTDKRVERIHESEVRTFVARPKLGKRQTTHRAYSHVAHDDRDAPLHVVGKAIGVSRERVRQLEQKSFKTLRSNPILIELMTGDAPPRAKPGAPKPHAWTPAHEAALLRARQGLHLPWHARPTAA